MKMEKVKCQIITPMLMHGENTNVAELRPPAIKGAMRFWWRAIHGNLNLTQLKEQESRLFGGAGDGNAVRSSFRIKLQSKCLKTKEADPLPHKPKNKDGSPKFTIKGYEENQSFTVEFIGQEVESIRRIFELTTILGGFGLRSRRGFGSIEIINKNNTKVTEEYIKGLITNINKNFKYTSVVPYPYIKEIQIGKQYQDFNSLLKVIYKATSGKCGKHLFYDPRFSSPIYVSVLKLSEKDYRPIITTLNCTSDKFKNKTREQGLSVMNEFKGAIL